MGWYERVLKGQFRGVPFSTDSAERGSGHRVIVHQYPNRNTPYAENLGRKPITFTLDCFVWGDDYMDQRDRLIDALEKPGTGTLVHPYYGTLAVQVEDYRERQTTREGGKAFFQIIFVEPGNNAQPDTGLGTGALVDDKANAAMLAVNTDFAQRFSVSGQPQFVSDSAVDVLNDAASAVNTTNGKVAAATSSINQATSAVNSFTNNLSSLVQQPANLVQDLTGLVVTISTLPSSVDAALAAYEGLFSFGDDLVLPSRITPARARQSDNQDAVTRAMQIAALIEAMRASAKLNYSSRSEAINVVNRLVDEVDRQAQTQRADGESLSDPLYNSLVALQSAMVRDVNRRSASLSTLTTHTPLQTIPAILIAYELYGQASRESEIVSRNNIRHPGHVMGGVALEVIAGD